MAKYSYSPEFIAALPKTDLHLHLDGSLRIPTLIDLAQKQGVELPSYTEEGLKELVFLDSYESLGEYLRGFAYTCSVLRDAESLERTAYELAADCFAEGVRYIEVRFAPQLHVNARMDMAETLTAMAKGLERAEKQFNGRPEVKDGTEPPARAGIIACAMRFFDERFSPYYRDYVTLHRYRSIREIISLASVDLVKAVVRIRDTYGLPIVGFDLAGQENGYPAGVHKDAYEFAHRNFLKRTVHAGEAFGPESIFQAITELHADRIGHGYHLFSPELIVDKSVQDPERYIDALAQYIADRRITIEVCLTSNLQTNPEIGIASNHRLKDMIEARLSVTLCTDNRLVSNTTIDKEILLATENIDIPPKRLKNLIVYGFKRSFFPGTYIEKRAYTRKIIDYYDRVEEKFGITDESTRNSG